jgi:hypothetical protein
MIQVIDNKITKYSLPKSGRLSTGETVSGYHLLDEEILKQEGWLPLEELRPEYDSGTHYLQPNGYDIQEDKVVRLYEIVEIPPREPDSMERIRDLEETLNILLGNEE